MARLNYVDPSASPDLAPLAEQIKKERSGRVHNLYKMLLNSPPVAAGWLHMGTAVRYQSNLDGHSRELAICMVARLTRAEYEWHHHAPLARREGVTDEQLAALPEWRGKDCFDAREQALLAYTEVMTRQIEVDDPTFDALRSFYAERELLELTVTIGFYNMVSRVLVALQMDIDAPHV